VWDDLDREKNKRQPTSKEKLWNVPQEAWRTIPEDNLKKIASISCFACNISRNEGWPKTFAQYCTSAVCLPNLCGTNVNKRKMRKASESKIVVTPRDRPKRSSILEVDINVEN